MTKEEDKQEIRTSLSELERYECKVYTSSGVVPSDNVYDHLIGYCTNTPREVLGKLFRDFKILGYQSSACSGDYGYFSRIYNPFKENLKDSTGYSRGLLICGFKGSPILGTTISLGLDEIIGDLIANEKFYEKFGRTHRRKMSAEEARDGFANQLSTFLSAFFVKQHQKYPDNDYYRRLYQASLNSYLEILAVCFNILNPTEQDLKRFIENSKLGKIENE